MVTKSAQDYIDSLASELDISETRYDQAYSRYHSIGEWLNRDKSSIKQYDPTIYVQGSFAFGTVIKPNNDTEEYDVDMVCELRQLSTDDLSQERLKHLIGVEIDEYRIANNMEKPISEKRRCWTLNYADGAQFYIDIIPALPNSGWVRALLEERRMDAKWADTAIGITDNEEHNYSLITNDWPRSNPKGYMQWFKTCMATQLESRKIKLAEEIRASVDDIPDYRVKTPLQSAIMILKRHRDIMFEEDQSNSSPISIIITTLAGHSYNGEEHVAEALLSILSKMDEFIIIDGDKCIVSNPSDPSENFADKWEEYPERKEAFFGWLEQARSDFRSIANLYSRTDIAEVLSTRIGQELAKNSLSRSSGEGSSGLLKGASAASAAVVESEPSFGNEPRIPTKPKGFA